MSILRSAFDCTEQAPRRAPVLAAGPSETRARRPRVLLGMEWLDYELNFGVAEFARKHGWIIDDVVSHTGQPDPDWNGDGIIALLRQPKSELVKFVRGATMPVVDLVNELPEFGVPRVLADNHAVGRVAAEHLLSCGMHHFAFVNLWNSHVEQERMAGFRGAIEQAGRAFYAIEQKRQCRGHVQVLEWIRDELVPLPKPLGVMGQHDREAIYIIQACEMAGLHVPEQVAVVGSDNDPVLCELGPVPLSSVDNRRRNQGYEAAKLLQKLMDGGPAPSQPIRVPTGPVIVRYSSEVLAVSDPDLSCALRFIAGELPPADQRAGRRAPRRHHASAAVHAVRGTPGSADPRRDPAPPHGPGPQPAGDDDQQAVLGRAGVRVQRRPAVHAGVHARDGHRAQPLPPRAGTARRREAVGPMPCRRTSGTGTPVVTPRQSGQADKCHRDSSRAAGVRPGSSANARSSDARAAARSWRLRERTADSRCAAA